MFNKKQTVRDYCDQNREEVLKWYAQTQPLGDKVGLEKAFVDLNGKQYYRITGSSTIMPLERMGKMQDYLTMMAAGLDNKELEALIDVANNELALALAGKKGDVVKIGAVLSQIKERQQMILHDQLLYNYMAVQFIREDEPVAYFTDSIHMEKVQAIMDLVRHNKDYSFFQCPELRIVNDLLRCSPEEWETLLQDSIRERERLQRKLTLLRGVKGLGQDKKTSAATV